MKQIIPALPERMKPYKSIIWFVVTLFAANFFWKYNILGDDSNTIDSTVTFWGLDISAPFRFMAIETGKLTVRILHLAGWDITLLSSNSLEYENRHLVRIIWACTGLKQTFIFICIMLTSAGTFFNKSIYTLATIVAIFLINLVRILAITIIVIYHPEWFILVHEYILKYGFYILLFLMWLYWEEKISKKKSLLNVLSQAYSKLR